jgi:hypothetical protein
VATVEDPYTKEAGDTIETPIDQTFRSIITEQRNFRTRQSQHQLPSRQPLVVGDIVLSRVLDAVRSHDLASGEFILQTSGWDSVLEELIYPRDGEEIPNWKTHAGQLLNQRLWEDGTFGRMSSDGVRVYWIEEMGFWIPISSGKERAVIPVRTSNVLSAHDLETGKLAWERGGELGIKAERNLAGRFFLGSPLPMAGRLYCLVDVNQEIQLNVLNAATGELEWSQPLATPNQQTIAQDLGRRTSGVSVAYADGSGTAGRHFK